MANGIISSLQIGGGDIGVFTTPYGVCSTAAETAAKTVTVNGDFVLATGARVMINFSKGVQFMPSATLSLNVNSTGAKYIRLDPADSSGSDYTLSKYFTSDAGRVYEFVYDGTYWLLLTRDHDTDTNTTYTGSTPISVSGSTISHSTNSGYKHVPPHSYTTAGSYYLTNSSTAGAGQWSLVFGRVAADTDGGIILGLDLTSNTVSTHGGGNSIAAGASNTISGNIKQSFTFGGSNKIQNGTKEGTTSVSRYNFLAGYGNSSGSSTGSTGSVSSIAMGMGNTVYSGLSSTYEGTSSTRHQASSIALGSNNTAGSSGTTNTGVAIGWSNTASGHNGVAIGRNNTASGNYSTALGYHNTAAAFQTTVGKYAKAKDGAASATTTSGFPFLVGNGTGTGTSTSNAFWVYSNGICYAEGAFTGSTASDYAECFEWSDGNSNNEDRRGRFVTFDFDDKIRFANANDDYILGIVSATPTVLGDAAADEWHGRYIRDIYGNIVEEEVDVEEIIDEETGEILEPARKEKRRKINPDYNPNQPYIPRYERPEWSAIGMMGKLVLDDDGTCEVGGFAAPGKDGIATRGTSINGYKVIARLDENHIRVIFK